MRYIEPPSPTAMFFVNLEPAANKKKVFEANKKKVCEVTRLCLAVVTVEKPRKFVRASGITRNIPNCITLVSSAVKSMPLWSVKHQKAFVLLVATVERCTQRYTKAFEYRLKSKGGLAQSQPNEAKDPTGFKVPVFIC